MAYEPFNSSVFSDDLHDLKFPLFHNQFTCLYVTNMSNVLKEHCYFFYTAFQEGSVWKTAYPFFILVNNDSAHIKCHQKLQSSHHYQSVLLVHVLFSDSDSSHFTALFLYLLMVCLWEKPYYVKREGLLLQFVVYFSLRPDTAGKTIAFSCTGQYCDLRLFCFYNLSFFSQISRKKTSKIHI